MDGAAATARYALPTAREGVHLDSVTVLPTVTLGGAYESKLLPKDFAGDRGVDVRSSSLRLRISVQAHKFPRVLTDCPARDQPLKPCGRPLEAPPLSVS